ncbi:MAG: DUF72 domain-containing protein, partial [Pseudomonadales bacterium]|nr:DUF72 domain-containing protein [Pseudomonadales bacterium]
LMTKRKDSGTSAVEINNTFYRMPRRSVLAGWAADVPESFRFVIKASRRITHFKRLKDAGEPMEYLITNVAELGPRLGAILFQLPPNMRVNLDRLRAFLDLIPEDVRATFEFRHESWFDGAVFEALRERNMPICHNDTEDALPLVSTADWGYLRLRRPRYDKRSLGKWIRVAGEEGWQDTFVFFKHEAEGAGPKLALKFLDQI